MLYFYLQSDQTDFVLIQYEKRPTRSNNMKMYINLL